MTQNWIVAVVVLVAAGYSLWYVLPTELRQRLGRIHHSLGPSKPCASCSSCGGCSSGKLPAEASTATQPEQTIRFYPPKKG
jgi:hypothetical protein